MFSPTQPAGGLHFVHGPVSGRGDVDQEARPVRPLWLQKAEIDVSGQFQDKAAALAVLDADSYAPHRDVSGRELLPLARGRVGNLPPIRAAL